MIGKGRSAKKSGGSLPLRVGELRAELASEEPSALAGRAGAEYRAAAEGGADILIPLWGKRVAVGVPGLVAREERTGKELPVSDQALLLYYFRTSDGSPLTGRWVSLGELPDGTFYQRAFQGYTGDMLGREFNDDIGAFSEAARSLGGRSEPCGDAAFSFRVLPRVPIAAVYWRGDEEFPPAARLLFDSSAGRHLPTDVCAIIGATLTGRLIKAHRTAGGGRR